MTPEERFVEKFVLGAVHPELGTCWEFLATGADEDYGRFLLEGRKVQAHRFAYKLWVGPIPPGHQVDHLCSNRPCVNWAHLEAVTGHENTWRMYLRVRSRT